MQKLSRREFEHVLNHILSPPKQIETVKRYCTEDVELHAQPLLRVKGRKAVLAAYRAWSLVNGGKVRFDLQELYISEDEANCFLLRGDTIHHFRPLPSFRLCWHSKIHLQDCDEQGTRHKKISKQHDDLLLIDTFVYQLPLLGPLLKKGLPTVFGAVLTQSMQLVGEALNLLGWPTETGRIASMPRKRRPLRRENACRSLPGPGTSDDFRSGQDSPNGAHEGDPAGAQGSAQGFPMEDAAGGKLADDGSSAAEELDVSSSAHPQPNASPPGHAAEPWEPAC